VRWPGKSGGIKKHEKLVHINDVLNLVPGLRSDKPEEEDPGLTAKFYE